MKKWKRNSRYVCGNACLSVCLCTTIPCPPLTEHSRASPEKKCDSPYRSWLQKEFLASFLLVFHTSNAAILSKGQAECYRNSRAQVFLQLCSKMHFLMHVGQVTKDSGELQQILLPFEEWCGTIPNGRVRGPWWCWNSQIFGEFTFLSDVIQSYQTRNHVCDKLVVVTSVVHVVLVLIDVPNVLLCVRCVLIDVLPDWGNTSTRHANTSHQHVTSGRHANTSGQHVTSPCHANTPRQHVTSACQHINMPTRS